MKTMVKTIAIGVIFMSSLAVFGSNNDPSFTVKRYGDKGVAVYANPVFSTQSQIVLEDMQGIILHSEPIAVNGSFNKLLNLNALPNGQYFLVYETDQLRKRIPVIIGTEGTFIDKEHATVDYFPRLSYHQHFVDLMHLSTGLKPVNVEIIDSKQQLVFSETLKNKLKVERRYDVSQLPKGEYTFKVFTNNHLSELQLSLNN